MSTLTLTAPGAAATATLRRLTDTVRDIARQPTLLLSWVVVLVAVAWAVVPDVFTDASPYEGDSALSFAPPGWGHPFGTDRLGRDLYSRAVHGASATLTATLIAVLVALTVGGLIGLVAGYFGRHVDTAVMRTVDVGLAIPSLLLAMVIVAMLGYSTRNIALAVGIASIASFARVMRAEVVRVVSSDYVEAADGVGARRAAVVLKHVLPNSMSSVLALAALEIGTSVLAVASLGFLGYGAPPPEPEWGLLVAEGRDFVGQYPWISVLPGVLIAALVLSSHRIATSFRRSHQETS
ncbi:ABC transporter permease [Cellulomonas chitinilytica]|uniref:ABC transporter permease n=1 Tax=Cellulomonas chitinilytica TaxID=398759 RepID=A0A919U016_9CELL|nr:ABC transporter permease [Cellulomonas chitinilytica]GIG19986.1 ABC transporter permease [Cellulomonas chitinilytica]